MAIRLKPGPRDASPGETEQKLLEHKEQIRIWLEPDNGYKRGLRLTKVQRLLERHGVVVAYGSLYRFAVKHLEFGKHKTTVRVADLEPGELAEVDFGKLGLLPHPAATSTPSQAGSCHDPMFIDPSTRYQPAPDSLDTISTLTALRRSAFCRVVPCILRPP